MFYDTELSFLTSILKNYHIQTHLLTEDTAQKCNLDLGLRKLLGQDIRLPLQHFIKEHIRPKTFYRITDSFHCKYVMFLLPQTEPATTMVIGPYACMEITKEIIYQIIDEVLQQPSRFYRRQPAQFSAQHLWRENMGRSGSLYDSFRQPYF